MTHNHNIDAEPSKAKFYKDMGILEYHEQTGVLSKTMLSKFADCPARFKYSYIDGGEAKQTKSLRIGTAMHVLALEPELWRAGYHILPETYFNDKGEEKEWRNDKRMQVYKDEMALAGDRVLLTRKEYQILEAMAEALSKNSYALSLLKSPGYVESSIFWEENGMPVRCRPDFLRNDGLIIDLKTARSADPDIFMKDAFNLHYDLSVALTWRGYSALHGKAPDNYVFLVIEPEPPHLISCFEVLTPLDKMVDLTYLDYGQAHLDKLLAGIAECKETNIWPGYISKIEGMKLPQWAVKKFIESGV